MVSYCVQSRITIHCGRLNGGRSSQRRLLAAGDGVVGDGGPADQLVTAAGEGDAAAVARLLAAGGDPNALVSGQLPSGEVLQTTALHGPGPPGAVKRP